MQQYEFLEILKTSTDKFKSKEELYDRFQNDRETSLDESPKLDAYFRKNSRIEIYLVIVRDHAKNTLNLLVSTKNRIAEMRLNLKYIPIPDMIHLHKQTGEVIYSDLLKATLKVSKFSLHILILKIS